MIQTQIPERAAYEFSDSLKITARSTPQDTPVSETLARKGFYLVDSRMEGAHVQRLLAQYILGEPFLAGIKSRDIVPRRELELEHRRQYAAPKRPFGLEIPWGLASTLRNDAPTAPDGKSPPPFDALHAPSVVPLLPEGEPAVGQTWKGGIKVACGFGIYALEYDAKWADISGATALAEITFPVQEKTAGGKGITLIFKAEGTWKTALRLPYATPYGASGKMQYIVSGKRGKAAAAELLNIQLQFDWRRAMLPYTDKEVLGETWAKNPVCP